MPLTDRFEEQIGEATIRVIAAKAGGFDGVVIRSGSRGEILHDEDHGDLVARLRAEAGKLHPNYYGIAGAITRFLDFFPGGFQGRRYRSADSERAYKVAARKTLIETLPLERARSATTADAIAIRDAFKPGRLWTNMPHTVESTRIREILAGKNGPDYLRAAARFAEGDYAAGLAGIRAAAAPHGHPSWPIATYLPFLWLPERHMFLKPTTTRDFAEHIGHPFAHEYEAGLDERVYRSLLDLAETTAIGIVDLKPEDRIDVQSFIWVVGEYREEDRLPTA